MKNRYWLLIGLVTLGVLLVLLLVSRSDYEALQQENESLEANYAQLDNNYITVNNELAEIRKVHPPRDFSSLEELQNWLLSNDVSELPPASTVEQLYSKGLTIQEDALKDGYIISVDFEVPYPFMYFVYGVAIIDGNIWLWEVETDEPWKAEGLDKVK